MIADSSTVEKSTIVVVGNGMVGHAFCEKLVQLELTNQYSVTVFGKETRHAYDRVQLTKYLTNRSADDLELVPRQWYDDNGIDLKLNQTVVSLDCDQKVIVIDTGEQQRYDKLILATGSRPFVPPISGAKQPGVFVYRTIEDLEAICQYAKKVSSAAVIGGGLLGLEAAKALSDLELQTHIVEVAPILMPRQLDSEGGKLLQSKIEELGINIHLLKRTEEIRSFETGKRVCFKGGENLDVGMVVISAGIRPHNELAEPANLETGSLGGFLVDDRLQTSQPDVFAIGECAQHSGKIYGLVAPGHQMADVLAKNMAGQKQVFREGDMSASLKLFGIDVVTLGSPLGETQNANVVASGDEQGYRKLILQRGRVVGAISVGQWSEVNRVRQAIFSGTRIRTSNLRRFQRTGKLWNETESVNQWASGAIVCSCKSVTRETLTRAKLEGADTPELLAACTGASTVCGSCKSLLCELAGSDAVYKKPRTRGLLIAAMSSLLVSLLWIFGPVPFSETVQHLWHRVDFIWRDSFWKQFTGYSLLGISAVGLLLPLRKRIKRFKFGEFGFWRTMHSVVGFLTLVGLVVHTGMHLGSNLNFVLAAVFLTLNVTGVFTAVVTSMEDRVEGQTAMRLRQLRPRLSRIHLWLFLPLPVLVILHIAAVYYY